MEIINRIPRMRMLARKLKRDGGKLALVPTMSALHEGHLSLIRRAQQMADIVIVSIFFNPAQFSLASDSDAELVHRDLARDAELIANKGVDYLFAPSVDEIYPEDFLTYVTTDILDNRLCGANQPHYFRGVATIVNKLINIVQPDFTFVGQKDAQQSIIIRRMVRDLSMDTEVVICPSLREPDGLVVSSRNAYLNPLERRTAPVLFRSLEVARERFAQGERNTAALAAAVRATLESEPLVRVEYVAVADLDTLAAVAELRDDVPILVAIAAHVGHVRLIDNIVIEPLETE
jgi:pantoate--beta-alanine ligase